MAAKKATKAARLSDVQRAALETVNGAGGTATLALFSARTAAALVRAGLIVGRTAVRGGTQRFIITKAGAVALARSAKAVDRAVRRG